MLDKLANPTDRPARPVPPAWPVFTDKYQDFPKWRKDIMSYLKDYCSSLKQETVETRMVGSQLNIFSNNHWLIYQISVGGLLYIYGDLLESPH